LTKGKLKLDVNRVQKFLHLMFPVSAVLFTLFSYFLSGFVIDYMHKGQKTSYFPATEWFLTIKKVMSDLSNKKKNLTSRIGLIEENFSKEQILKPDVFSPLNCYRRTVVKKTTSQNIAKKKKVRLNFSFDVEVKLIAVMGKHGLVTINGYDIKEKSATILNCGAGRCYVKVLKVKENGVKVYIAPANYKSRGKVSWLRRGKNVVKLSFYAP